MNRNLITKIDGKDYIINNIETIYGFIENNSSIISLLYIVLFLFCTLNMMCFWTFNYMVSTVKNNYYCLNQDIGEFEKCESKDFCTPYDFAVTNLAYIDDKSIISNNEDEELFC